MSNFIFKFLSLFLIFFILLFFVSNLDNIDKAYQENRNIETLQSMSLHDSLDVLFLGNSYCYSSVNTRYLDSLGKKVYNLGIATAGVDFYNLIWKDYLESVSCPPRRVLILVSPMTFSDKADNFSEYPIHRYLNNPISHFELYNNGANIALPVAYQNSLEKGIGNIISSTKPEKIKNRLDYRMEQSFNLGFHPNWTVSNSTILADQYPKMASLMEESFDIHRFVELCRFTNNIEKMGIETVYFEIPTNNLYAYFNNDYMSQYYHCLKLLLNRDKLIQVSSNAVNTSHYRNIDHLNSFGAQIITKELMEKLW